MKITTKKRENWIDYAKFIGIFFVVLGHTLNENDLPELCSWIFSFHMPLFFLLGGYFAKDNEPVLSVLKKSMRGLLIPYVCFYIFTYIGELTLLIIKKGTSPLSIHENVLLPFLGFLLGEQSEIAIHVNIPLWFLFALFFCRIFFQIAIRNKRGRGLKLILINVISIIIILFLNAKQINIYFDIDSAIMGIPFFTVGYIYKKYASSGFFSFRYNFMIFLVCLAVSILAYHSNSDGGIRTDMAAIKYGSNILLFYANGIIGSLAVIYLSKLLDSRKYKILLGLGRNTIIIFGIHICMIHYIVPAIVKIKSLINWPYSTSLSESIEVTVLIMILSIPFIHIINTFFPFMVGKFNKQLKY